MVFIQEDIKVEKTQYQGKDYISIRKWYKDRESGELKPGKNGINMDMEAWAEFVEKFDEIVEDMEMS